MRISCVSFVFFFFQAEDGIRDGRVTGVQTCALPISRSRCHTLAGGCDAAGGNMTERDRDVDIVVIGMGPGGEWAADTLAEAGLVVAGVEDRLVGGECPYWGCVPSKMMIRAANLIM